MLSALIHSEDREEPTERLRIVQTRCHMGVDAQAAEQIAFEVYSPPCVAAAAARRKGLNI
jgi:hypothetical protein